MKDIREYVRPDRVMVENQLAWSIVRALEGLEASLAKSPTYGRDEQKGMVTDVINQLAREFNVMPAVESGVPDIMDLANAKFDAGTAELAQN